jgi:CBS domain-containing protein
MAEERPSSTPVRDVMTAEVVACRPSDELYVAQQLMAGHQKSRIVCTDEDGTIAGVISLSDIALHVDGSYPAETLREVARREIRP